MRSNKFLLSILLSCLSAPGIAYLSQAAASEIVPVEKAAEFIGQEVTVEGVVAVAGHFSPKGDGLINFGDGYPRQIFTIRVLRAAGYMPLDQLGFIAGRTLRATGKITDDKGKPKMVLSSTESIKVLPLDVDAVLSREINDYVTAMHYTQAVRQLLLAGEFSRLEELGQHLLDKQPITKHGAWQANLFLKAFTLGLTPGRDDQLIKEKIERWLSAAKNKNIARLAAVHFWHSYAWQGRGGGYAREVTEQGWEDFGQRLEKAWELMQEIGEALEDCPQYHEKMMDFAREMLCSREMFEEIYNKASERWPEYHSLHNSAIFTLLPRWLGEPGDAEKFLEEIPKRIPGDTGKIAQLQCALTLMRRDERFKNNPPLERAAFREGLDARLRRYPDCPYIVNLNARDALRIRDREYARKFMDMIGERPDMQIWDLWMNYDCYRNWVYRGGHCGLMGEKVTEEEVQDVKNRPLITEDET
jgi:hypothetical protein